MFGLQKSFDNLVRKYTEPALLLHQLIRKQLRTAGIELTENQDAHLFNKCKNLKDFQFTFDLTDGQLAATGCMHEEDLRRHIQELFDTLPEKLGEFAEHLEETVTKIVNDSSEEISQLLVAELNRLSQEMLRDQRRLHQKFNRNNYSAWKIAIDYLEMVIVSAIEAGEGYMQMIEKNAMKTDSITFDVLSRLHARACLISKEILLLLKNGYPDGAHARWRSLHEVVVVADLISTYGSDLAERYTQHEVVENYKAALLHQKHANTIGYEALSNNEMEQIVAEYYDVIEKYGKSFQHEYGWASCVLGVQKPSFADIERIVNLSHYRPQYKMASHNIHANPKGAFFKLGLFEDMDYLLAGPSNLGLSEPGRHTAHSLFQITTSFVLREPTLDFIVVCKAIKKLAAETEDAFLKVEAMQEANLMDV
jgi:hypothetical protein